jgi:hypothetical protein
MRWRHTRRASVCLLARPLPRRWLHLARPTGVQAADRSGCSVPLLINLAKHAIARVRTGNGKVGTVKKVACVEIYGYWTHWPCLFPQHGPGRKHLREIVLTPWQTEIVDTYPRQMIRGLIHSDGCRTINRVWNGRYTYPRYFFTNNSDDILQIFRDTCNRVGIGNRNSKPNTISVAKRQDLATLDRFIGPKA